MARITPAQKKALALLKQARVRTVPVPLEKLARLLNAEIHLEPFVGKLSGMVHRNTEGIAVIGVNSLEAPTRRRFTIAHEIGHMVLHEGQLHIDEKFPIGFRDEKSSLGVDVKEIEANQFASELLMPRHFLEDDIASLPAETEVDVAIEQLARKYHVSSHAMSLRLSWLGFIT